MTTSVKVITSAEAAKYNAAKYPVFWFVGPDAQVLIVDGDLTIEGDFSAWYKKETKRLKLKHSLLIVTGDLHVAGDVIDPFILVLGDLHCHYLFSREATTDIIGDATIRDAFFGQYPEGQITIGGTTKVPFFLNADHGTVINLDENSILIGGDGFFDYDLKPDDFEDVMVEQVLFDEDDIEDTIIAMIREGKSPFKNISDSDFSLTFDKETLLKKIRGSGN